MSLQRLVDRALMLSRCTVDVGARFRQVGGGSGVWMLVDFAADYAGKPHARLALESDRTRTIMIAVAALKNRKLYERLHGISRTPAATNDEFIG